MPMANRLAALLVADVALLVAVEQLFGGVTAVTVAGPAKDTTKEWSKLVG